MARTRSSGAHELSPASPSARGRKTAAAPASPRATLHAWAKPHKYDKSGACAAWGATTPFALTPLGATAPCTRLPNLHAGGGDRRHGGALCGRAVRLHGRLCHDLHSYRSVGRGAPLHRGKSPAPQWRTSRRARVGCCVGRCVRWWRERADPYVLFHRAAQERGPAEKRTLFGLYVFSTGLIVRRPALCRLCPLQR